MLRTQSVDKTVHHYRLTSEVHVYEVFRIEPGIEYSVLTTIFIKSEVVCYET